MTAEVVGHSPEQFLVEAETSAAATGLVLAWLAGHESICLQQGHWVKSEDVSPELRAADPVETDGIDALSPGSFFIDGRAGRVGAVDPRVRRSAKKRGTLLVGGGAGT